MIDDLDLWRAAKLLVDHFGEDAVARAAKRADELLIDGDVEGCAVWRRITKAVQELLVTEPDGPVN